MKKRMSLGILGTLLVCLAAPAHAQVFTYTDEASYLNDLVGFGFGTLQEGFEDDATWGGARFPNAAPQVTSQGIIWTANNLTSQMSTSGGAARTGLWGVFALPHGITTGALLTPQHDGFIGTSTSAVFGIGGWLVSNTGGAQVLFMLDGDPIDFADPTLTNVYRFFGVIDTAGFSTFEIVETDGTVEDQENIFADDFSFGTLAVAGCGNGIIEAGEQCDDGGTTPGDGCDAICEIEPGWTCEGEPSVCTALPVPSISLGGLALLGGLVLAIALGGLAVQRRRRTASSTASIRTAPEPKPAADGSDARVSVRLRGPRAMGATEERP
jgi:cysteine-rich repeat protein